MNRWRGKRGWGRCVDAVCEVRVQGVIRLFSREMRRKCVASLGRAGFTPAMAGINPALLWVAGDSQAWDKYTK